MQTLGLYGVWLYVSYNIHQYTSILYNVPQQTHNKGGLPCRVAAPNPLIGGLTTPATSSYGPPCRVTHGHHTPKSNDCN